MLATYIESTCHFNHNPRPFSFVTLTPLLTLNLKLGARCATDFGHPTMVEFASPKESFGIC
jgi:hypothetical protein